MSWVLLGERGVFWGEVQVSRTGVLRLSAAAPAELSLVCANRVSPGHGVTMEERHQPIKPDPRGKPQGKT